MLEVEVRSVVASAGWRCPKGERTKEVGRRSGCGKKFATTARRIESCLEVAPDDLYG